MNVLDNVVYSGRKNGVYYSWIDCFVQVNKFGGSAYEVFNSPMEAKMAWEGFYRSSMKDKKEIIRVVNMKQEATTRMTTLIGTGRYDSDLLPSNSCNGYMAQWNMQLCLRQVCHRLRISDANYTRVEEKMIEGHTYYRYRASLPTQVIGMPPISVGRYATDDNEAREDVALLLLQRLQATTGMRITYFNYSNVL
ncbi:Ribosomal protein L9/RNase H1, N-terminal [Sesbania bispinosa]|nr:Ribosomal protein L9/RNase H1, N-terminal [Sesbania bispinosa]